MKTIMIGVVKIVITMAFSFTMFAFQIVIALSSLSFRFAKFSSNNRIATDSKTPKRITILKIDAVERV